MRLPIASAFALLAICALAHAQGVAPRPVAISPGNATQASGVAGACPTFNWGVAARVEAFELAVHVAGDTPGESAAVLSEILPGVASGWTPSLERCLRPGTRYTWTVRALGRGGASDWAEPMHFHVAADPRVVAGDKAAPSQLQVDGSISGTGFTGDGSGLANVDAATLDGVDGTGYAGSGQACPAGFYVKGIDALGDVVCASLAAYVNESCQLYFGWRDNCDSCTVAPVKWGRVSAAACENGAGVNNTCQSSVLGSETVNLLGINPDGDVDDTDKFYIGIKCS